MSRAFVDGFLENMEYFIGLERSGKIIDSGVFPGKHSSYRVFEAEDEDAVKELLDAAPMGNGVEHEIEPALEVEEVAKRMRRMREKLPK